MRPNALGRVVEACWHGLPDHYAHLTLDAFVLMPNHVHGILVLTPSGRQSPLAAETNPSRGGIGKRHGLSEILRAFKTFSARRVNAIRRTSGEPVWQRGYFEHIIRNQTSLAEIRQYIAANPARWAVDRENPVNARRPSAVGTGSKSVPGMAGGR